MDHGPFNKIKCAKPLRLIVWTSSSLLIVIKRLYTAWQAKLCQQLFVQWWWWALNAHICYILQAVYSYCLFLTDRNLLIWRQFVKHLLLTGNSQCMANMVWTRAWRLIKVLWLVIGSGKEPGSLLLLGCCQSFLVFPKTFRTMDSGGLTNRRCTAEVD